HAWRGGARRRRLRCARERRAAEERAAAGEPAEMRFRLAERGLVSEPPGNRRVGPSGLLAGEGEVAVILDFMSLYRGQGCGVPATRGGKRAHEDPVAQRRRPGRTRGEPGAERPLAARGQAEHAPRARVRALVTPHDEPPPLELVEELVNLADVSRSRSKCFILLPISTSLSQVLLPLV